MISAPFIDRGLMREADGWKLLAAGVSFIIAVVLAFILPTVTDMGHRDSFVILCLPFIVLGIWDMVVGRKWIMLAVTVVPSAAAYLLGWKASAVLLMLLVGTVGVVSAIGLMHRLTIPAILDSAERCNSVPQPDKYQTVTRFMFGIPPDFDARNMMIEKRVRREGVPWKLMIDTLIPAFVLMIFLWMFIAAEAGSDSWSLILPAIAVTLYIVALATPWAMLGAIDARAEASGSEFRLFDGFIGTMKRMAIPAIAGFIVVIAATSPGLEMILPVIATSAFCVVVAMASLSLYGFDCEPEFVNDLASSWSASHPVDFYSGYDGKDRRHPLDDGVPGTPRRPADSCFQRQRN